MAQDRGNILLGQGPNGFRLVYCGAGFLPQLVETGDRDVHGRTTETENEVEVTGGHWAGTPCILAMEKRTTSSHIVS